MNVHNRSLYNGKKSGLPNTKVFFNFLKFYVGMGRYIGDQGNFKFAGLPLTKLFKFIRFSYLCLHLSGLETVCLCLSI